MVTLACDSNIRGNNLFGKLDSIEKHTQGGKNHSQEKKLCLLQELHPVIHDEPLDCCLQTFEAIVRDP
jgi:hypothetical protein